MAIILGLVLRREGGYAFDAWTPGNGLSRGYVYRRIEDAYYARKAEIRSPGKRYAGYTRHAARSMNSCERRSEA
jgi:hypothetical protein